MENAWELNFFWQNPYHLIKITIKFTFGLSLLFLVPSEPLNVVALARDTTSVNVTWSKPANTYGKILKYVVHYQELGIENRYDKTEVSESISSVVLTKLQMNTEYRVFVQAFTSAGGGMWSEVAKVKTESEGRKQTF